MMRVIHNLPASMVGFQATGEVTETDFKEVVIPEVEHTIQKNGKLNYMLVLNTSIKNFTAGAWIRDAIMGIKYLVRWNRAAIVTDVKRIRQFTAVFSKLMPGEFKGFAHKDLQAAIDWASERS